MEELVVSILTRLPPKSLMRFKCVHKSWNALTHNPGFVAKHLSISRHNDQLSSSGFAIFKRFFVFRGAERNEQEIVFSSFNLSSDTTDGDEEDNIIHSVGEDLSIPHWLPNFEALECVHMNSHCNGIICLSDFITRNIVLWNPAIKEFNLLPKSCFPIPRENTELAPEILGFGYDPKSDDYKVIQVVCNYSELIIDENDHVTYPPPKVEVYTIGSDCWREIKTDYLGTETTIVWPQLFYVCFKGVFYWSGHEQKRECNSMYFTPGSGDYVRELIVVFDTGADIFRHLLYPECFYFHLCSTPCDIDKRLDVWNECIVLSSLHCDQSSDIRSFELWVLDDFDDGIKGSWTKHFHFEPFPEITSSFQFWKSAEFLMVERRERIVSFNPYTRKLKSISFHNELLNLVEVIVHANSIVSVIRGNKLVTNDD